MINLIGVGIGGNKRFMTKIVVIFGTRPEAIKLCPVVLALKNNPAFDCKVCVTGQHREMLQQVLDVFGVVPDKDLALMQPNQTLGGLTSRAIAAIIWSGAAQARFVKENAVGVCVDRISDIPMVLQKLSTAEKRLISDNVRTIGERLRNGAYTLEAVSRFLGA